MSEVLSIRITSDIPLPTSHIRHLLGRILPPMIRLNSLIFAVRLTGLPAAGGLQPTTSGHYNLGCPTDTKGSAERSLCPSNASH